ncbi:MAG: hypothetical protein PUB42_01985 [Firmicutes bacterium]|nr:hypothetical protein [Bacillota bacterium]
MKSIVKKIFCTLGVSALFSECFAFNMPLALAADSEYTIRQESAYWDNVDIGGGGMVTGLVFHPKEKGLIYARTDVGGMYRYDIKKDKWIQLFDAFDDEKANFYGVDGMAIDPSNTDIIYAAAGQYEYNGYNGKSDVLKSVDRGKTWTKTNLNKRFGGNQNDRYYGECLAVDPINGNTIYCGTRFDGLYRSTDGAKTWSKVNGITVDGSTDSNGNIKYSGIRSVAIDEKSTRVNGRRSVVYAASDGVGVFKTEDGGISWSKMDGSPRNVKQVYVKNQELYVIANNGMYTDNLENGGLFYYNAKTKEWENITPPGLIRENSDGWLNAKIADVKVMKDSQGQKIIYVAKMQPQTIYMKHGDDDWVVIANNIHPQNVTYDPYMSWRNGDEINNGFMCGMEFNPFPEKSGTAEMWVINGDGIYSQINATKVCGEPLPKFRANVRGIEETCINTIVASPNGKKYVGIMDYSGYLIEDIFDYSRVTRFKKAESFSNIDQINGYMNTISSFDFCEENPDYMAVFTDSSYSSTKYGFVAVSQDGGQTWENKGYQQQANVAMGDVAVSCGLNENGAPVILAVACKISTTDVSVLRSEDWGKTWTECSGLPKNLIQSRYNSSRNLIEPDRVNKDIFYAYSYLEGKFYRSIDGGKTFTETGSITPQIKGRATTVRANPGHEGEVFVSANNKGLYRSQDSGLTFSPMDDITNVEGFAFGAKVPGTENIYSMFLLGKIGGVRGLYRSDDGGSEWILMNDADHGLGCSVMCIEGDRSTYGRVYVGTQGRGVMTAGPAPRDTKAMVSQISTDDTVCGSIVLDGMKQGNNGAKLIGALYNENKSLDKIILYSDITDIEQEVFKFNLGTDEIQGNMMFKCFLWDSTRQYPFMKSGEMTLTGN